MTDLEQLRAAIQATTHTPRPDAFYGLPEWVMRQMDSEGGLLIDCLDLLDRLQAAEGLLADANSFEHADGCSGRYPEHRCKCGRRDWETAYADYRVKYGVMP